MKCHAGVEFPSGKPCPKCGANLGDVCWPGINADLLANRSMIAALRNVQKIIAEAAMTGFNCHDGDWADRLFASQQMTSAAIKQATTPTLSHRN